MHVIGSGSKGNASIIYNKDTTILVDMGLSKERLVLGLNEIGRGIKDIDAFLITHNHSDHVSGARFVPVGKRYAREGTILLNEGNIIELNKKYTFISIEVEVLETSHDAIGFCGFLFKDLDTSETLLYMTDTGIIPSSSLEKMKNCDYYFIESNHDVFMLLNSGRPKILIDRILSDHGHLSNEQCGDYLSYIIGDKTKAIMLAHLSEECNEPKVALETVKTVLENEGLILNGIKFSCASQWESTDLC